MLRALGHVDPAAALADERRTVAWLEDTKIRALPPASREPLRAAADEAAWAAAFAAYCAQLGCPVSPARTGAALSWLLAHAVGLEYHDQAPRLAPSAAGLAGDAAELQQLTLDEQTLRGGAAAVTESAAGRCGGGG